MFSLQSLQWMQPACHGKHTPARSVICHRTVSASPPWVPGEARHPQVRQISPWQSWPTLRTTCFILAKTTPPNYHTLYFAALPKYGFFFKQTKRIVNRTTICITPVAGRSSGWCPLFGNQTGPIPPPTRTHCRHIAKVT